MSTRVLVQRITNLFNVRQLGLWVAPVAFGAGWLLFPALDYDWKIEMGFIPDPEAGSNQVQAAKDARLAAFQKAHGIDPLKAEAVEAEEEEEEEEEAADDAEEGSEEEGEEAAADGEEGGDEEEEEGDDGEEEEEEEEAVVIKPLYLPTKAKKLSPQDIWDNFTLKAVKMGEDDDDDEDEEEEDEE